MEVSAGADEDLAHSDNGLCRPTRKMVETGEGYPKGGGKVEFSGQPPSVHQRIHNLNVSTGLV